MLRRWVDENGQVHEESFVSDLAWVPSAVLTSATFSSSDVYRVDEQAAVRFENAVRDRVRRGVTFDGRPYSYLLLIDTGDTADDPSRLLRTWTSANGYHEEQQYLPGTGWRGSYIREDWLRGRYDGTFQPIDKAAADRIVERWEQQRRAEQG